jgi:glutamyl-Q tRNA(Asp) synthetase
MPCGDVVLRRADGLYSYQFVVVIDDAAQHITHVVRGADLLDSTPPQIYLHQLLHNPVPTYIHLPIATNAAGEKLSKQTKAPAIPPHGDAETLRKAIEFLGAAPGPGATCREILAATLSQPDSPTYPAQR